MFLNFYNTFYTHILNHFILNFYYFSFLLNFARDGEYISTIRMHFILDLFLTYFCISIFSIWTGSFCPDPAPTGSATLQET